MLSIKLGFSPLQKINQEVQIKKANRLKNYTNKKWYSTHFKKKTRGSNLNNGEVQCLLKTQEGQIKK